MSLSSLILIILKGSQSPHSPSYLHAGTTNNCSFLRISIKLYLKSCLTLIILPVVLALYILYFVNYSLFCQIEYNLCIRYVQDVTVWRCPRACHGEVHLLMLRRLLEHLKTMPACLTTTMTTMTTKTKRHRRLVHERWQLWRARAGRWWGRGSGWRAFSPLTGPEARDLMDGQESSRG